MPHGFDKSLSLLSSGAPDAKGPVDTDEPMSWIGVWVWQRDGDPKRGFAAATGRATYVPPMTSRWSATTSLVIGSPVFEPGEKVRAMALALVQTGGNNEFVWWEEMNVDIV
jgi:hypothetical protein